MRGECGACALHKKCAAPFSMPFVPMGWKETRKLLVVGVGKDRPEEEQRAMRKWLRTAGYSVRDVAYVEGVRCVHPDEPNMKQIRACRPFLLRVLQTLRPQVVIACGKTALRALTNDGGNTNIMHLRGTVFDVPGINPSPKVFGTYHPSSILSGGTHYEKLLIEDLQRPSWKELEWPEEYAPQSDIVSIDTEFTPERVIEVATADTRFARTWDLEAPGILKDARILAGQHIFVDMDSALRLGIPLREEWLRGIDLRDSLLLARMVDENRGKGGYDLETLLRSSYNVRPWKRKTDDIDEADPTKWPEDLRKERCRLDAWSSAVLVEKLEPLAKGPVEFTHRISATLHRIRHAGVMLDEKRFEEIASELYENRARAKDLLTKSALEYGMSEFEPTNDGHLRDLLFRRLGLSVVERTKKKGEPAVSKTTLTYHKENPTIKLLTEFNQADKLCGLIDGEKGIRPNVTGRFSAGEGTSVLHLPVNINPLQARTARRSSSRPNMQNWKAVMRRLVRSRWGDGAILDADYKSLEPYILGWIAKDEKYFNYFKQGKGYVGIGKEVYNRVVEKGTRDYRVIKEIVLGTNYGAGAKKIGTKLWIELGVKLSADFDEHIKEVAKGRKAYLRAFPGIKRFMDRQRDELLRTGQIKTLTGRVRHMPVPDGEDTPGFGHFLNSAYNYPIQSLASEVTGSALIDVEDAMCREFDISVTELHAMLLRHEWPLMPLLVNEIHDEIVADLPPDEVVNHKRVEEIVVETMKSVPSLRKACPAFTLGLDVETFIGPTWGIKE